MTTEITILLAFGAIVLVYISIVFLAILILEIILRKKDEETFSPRRMYELEERHKPDSD